MTDTSLNELFRAIGSLTSEVSALRRDIQESDVRAVENNRRADEHRTAIHRRVDEMMADVGALATDMVTVKKELAPTKQIADEVRAWKQRGIGALAVVGFGASALTYIITQYYQQILGWFSR